MDRRKFLGTSALLSAAAVAMPNSLEANAPQMPLTPAMNAGQGRVISSSPMLQNFASTSVGIAFAVCGTANGRAWVSENEDMSDAKRFVCGGYRVTGMDDKVIQIRVTGLKPSTRYYYTIEADRIDYTNGHSMLIVDSEKDPRIYSFVTAGPSTESHFCVINDTHAKFGTFDVLTQKIASLAPSCVVWNGDTASSHETVDSQCLTFFNPPIAISDYASFLPYLLCPGNHDSRGLANRHLERVWMFRQNEERLSRDWDLGRNFAVRVGDIAMIGLDTGEDKLDTNPLYCGLFASEEYRVAQVQWLKDALKEKEIASAPFLVAFCHIPIFDADPTHNPGDVYPEDKDPQYTNDYASWQRTCGELWGPLLDKAGCQAVISGHTHVFRYDAPDSARGWAQIVGGGPVAKDKISYPTIIDGRVEDGFLNIRVYNAMTDETVGEYSFKHK